MKALLRRAMCAAAVVFAYAGAAGAVTPAPMQGLNTGDEQNFSRAVDLSQTFALPELSYVPPVANRLSVSNVMSSVSLVTGLDLELGYKVDLTGRAAPFDAAGARAFDGLFLSSLDHSSLASGGNFIGATAALADDLHINVGMMSLASGDSTYTPDAFTALARIGGPQNAYNPRSANSILAGVTWDFATWGQLGIIGSHTNENDSVLGMTAPGAEATTSSLGVSARVHLGNGWVTTASYSEGTTQLDLKPGITLLGRGDDMPTRSFGIAIAKNGLFGDDALGLAVSRPALGATGGEFITMPGSGGRFFSRNHILEGMTPETDVEIGYVTTFLDGAVALQTNASYQMNFAGQTGNNAVQLLSRARIKF